MGGHSGVGELKRARIKEGENDGQRMRMSGGGEELRG